MEVFAVASGVLSTLDVLLRWAQQTRNTIKTWKDAPQQIKALLEELDHFTTVVEIAKHAQQKVPSDNENRMQPSLTTALRRRIEMSKPLWENLHSLANKCNQNSTNKRVRRTRWAFSRTDIDELRKRLEQERMLLVEILELTNTLSVNYVNEQLSSVQNNAHIYHLETLSHLHRHSMSIQKQSSEISMVKELLGSTLELNKAIAQSSISTQKILQDIQTDTNIHALLHELKSYATAGYIAGPHASLPRGRPAMSDKIPLMLETAQTGVPDCHPHCRCACHKMQRYRVFKAFWIIKDFIGGFSFRKYTCINPDMCTEAGCGNFGMNAYEVGYVCPKWLSKWSVHATLLNPWCGKPFLGINLRRRVDFWEEHSIMRLVDDGDIDEMRKLLNTMRIFLDDLDPEYGYTPLHRAIGKCDTDMARFMLQAGANPDIQDDRGVSARDEATLCFFASDDNGFRTQLNELFSIEPHLESWDLSFIHKIVLDRVSVRIEDIPMDQYLVSQLENRDRHGRTPLHWAVIRGDLKAKANVNAVDCYRKTPLHLAAESASFQIFKLLIESKANINARTLIGEQAIHKVCRSQDNPAFLSLLAAAGADVNATTRVGNHFTPARAAIIGDKGSILEELIRYKADVISPDKDGDCPLFEAVMCRSIDCIRTFLKHPDMLNLTQTNLKGQTLLHFAALHADVGTLDVLTAARLRELDPNALNSEGFTAEQFLNHELSEEHTSAFQGVIESPGVRKLT